MLLRVRITLPDKPGSLAQITRVLGAAGTDITQVTVLERGAGRAVDDLTVHCPDEASKQALLDGLAGVPEVTVEGIWSTREAPGTYPELEILKYITTAGDRALKTLVDSLPVLFSADWAATATERDVVYASWRAPKQVALARAGPAPPDGPHTRRRPARHPRPAAAARPLPPAGPERRPRLPPHRGAPPHPHPGDLPHPARDRAKCRPPL